MKKISVIFGTRPEAIKLAPVILELKRFPELFQCTVCITAQHRQMLDQVLATFAIVPDVDLDLMVKDQTLAGFTSRALTALDGFLQEENPDLIIVQGDTTTVFCAALAAFYNHVPVAHVEAGLRTGNIYAPWPEEINRVLASRLTRLHFAPTQGSCDNLLKEGVSPDSVFVTGNTVIDALLLAIEKTRSSAPPIPGLPDNNTASFEGKKIVLITGHRRENFGEGFDSICRAVAALADENPDAVFIYPVHLNPNVQEPVHRILGNGTRKNLFLIQPLDYLPFVSLMQQSYLILTDSGGIQEEAPAIGKPVLVMRDKTERPEALGTGTVQLVGTNEKSIITAVSALLNDPELYKQTAVKSFLYGSGTAAKQIVEILRHFFSNL